MDASHGSTERNSAYIETSKTQRKNAKPKTRKRSPRIPRPRKRNATQESPAAAWTPRTRCPSQGGVHLTPAAAAAGGTAGLRAVGHATTISAAMHTGSCPTRSPVSTKLTAKFSTFGPTEHIHASSSLRRVCTVNFSSPLRPRDMLSRATHEQKLRPVGQPGR